MENMDDSFELLSSMSPKLKGRQKTLNKAIKILALKKNIRRSSIYDKARAVNNEDLDIVDRSTESSNSSCSYKNVFNKDKNNEDNVVIIDSTDSEEENDVRPRNEKLSSDVMKCCDTNNDPKVNRIQEWLNNIDLDEKKDNTFFSQVSTIYGDESHKFNPDGNGAAASSTFNEYLTRRFDELFVTDKNGLKDKAPVDLLLEDSFSAEINTSLTSKLKENSKTYKNDNSINTSQNSNNSKITGFEGLDNIKNLVVDETLLTSDESNLISNSLNSLTFAPEQAELKENSKSHLVTYKNDNGVNTSKNSDNSKIIGLKGSDNVKNLVIDESLLTSDESNLISNTCNSLIFTPEQAEPVRNEFVTARKKKDTKVELPKDGTLDNLEEMETMLDSLYGTKWRKKQDHVLPLSEPKRKPVKSDENKILPPKTERITKILKEDNLERNSSPVGKKLNFNKLKAPVASPWMERLKGLVDSDSDSNTETRTHEGMEKVKTRLDFCDDSPLPKNNIQKTEKQPNFDQSLSESLEDRIRNKISNFKIPTETKKTVKGRKNKNHNKENVPIKENIDKKKNKELKHNAKEKPSSEKGNTKNTVGVKNIPKSKEKKILKSKSNTSVNSCDEIEISSDEEYDEEISKMYEIKRKSVMPLKDGCYSFLESLSAHIPINKCDMTARIFRTCFKTYRDELTKKLFSMYNEKVFDNVIPSSTELEWNDKLRNTAGLCYCKKITHRDGKVVRKVKIALSSKVLDSPDRLRDTLIHEMCHAGTWIINQISNGHGVFWKNWAFKAMKVFPELPPIKRCHSYQINTKYTYKCTGCGYSFGRHSKSLDTERKRCGHCYGKFEVLINKTLKSGEIKSVPVTPKKEPTGFALFVKENYSRYKQPSKTHGDVMKVLGQKFSELKVKNTK